MGNTPGRRNSRYATSVHPHVHGEHVDGALTGKGAHGSSPRTWGTHPGGPSGEGQDRFIPTYMGNTGCRHGNPHLSSVHPHVHGEHFAAVPGALFAIGSSPRTWGTLECPPGLLVEGRFIPTYMGNTSSSRLSPTGRTVHPHVHGEHITASGGRVSGSGSSPRTWGTHRSG